MQTACYHRLMDAKRCAVGLALGKRLEHIPQSGPYHACLTESQKAQLFGSKPVPHDVGCGTFACVYPVGDRVVKITRDREDADAMVAAQGIAGVAKVYGAHELRQAGTDDRTGKPVDLYALEVERLKPLPENVRRDLNPALQVLRRGLLNYAQAYKGPPSALSLPALPAMARAACRKASGVGACQRLLEDVGEAFVDMAKIGIVWQDIHARNIALDKQGHAKVIDLGFSGAKRVEIPALAGPGRQRP